MSFSRRTKVAWLIGSLVLASLAAGFVLGVGTARAFAKKKEDPKFWKPAAMKQLERVHPTESQRAQFSVILEETAAELAVIRTSTVSRTEEVVARALADIYQELTPEQRQIFDKIKPRKKASENAH